MASPRVDIRFNTKPLGLKDSPNMLRSTVSMQHLGSASPDVRVPSQTHAHVHIFEQCTGRTVL